MPLAVGKGGVGVSKRGGRYNPEYLPHGTLISGNWDEDYVEIVRQAEEQMGYAICGKKKRSWTEDQPELERPCRQKAGLGTDHMGEGRCKYHDNASSLKHGRYSMLKHRNISKRVEEYFESQDIMDIRNAVVTAWAALDTALDDNATIDMERAVEIASTMSRISTMVKQHHDITEGQRLVIDIPQFMEWAEFLYSVAIRHILLVGGDPAQFLNEAQSYYTSAIGSVIGHSAPQIGPGDTDAA